MHTGPINEGAGTLNKPTIVEGESCPKCHSPIQHQLWESSDGGFEDSKYSCTNEKCNWTRWVDGIDS